MRSRRGPPKVNPSRTLNGETHRLEVNANAAAVCGEDQCGKIGYGESGRKIWKGFDQAVKKLYSNPAGVPRQRIHWTEEMQPADPTVINQRVSRAG
jgi:hypothetical protein